MLFLLLTFIVVFTLYITFFSRSPKKPRVFVKHGSELHKSASSLSFLKEPYHPPWWARNGILMTLLRTFQSKPDLPWEREMVTFTDGGIASLDWLNPEDGQENTTLMILFPGITGHTHEATYLWNPAKEGFKKGWRVLVINRRGLGVPLKTPKIAGYENTDDVTYILENYVAPRYPKATKVGCGFSMGGMILINYLATRENSNAIIDFGISISSPFDVHATSRNMSSFFTRLFLSRTVALSLVDFVKPHKEVLEDHVDWDLVCGSREVGWFEHHCTVPLNGYKDVNHYYIETSPYMKVERVPVPFLVLTSEDDYFVPIDWMPYEKFRNSENVMCVVTSHGGHTAYMEKSDINECGFVERVLFEWAAMHLKAEDDSDK